MPRVALLSFIISYFIVFPSLGTTSDTIIRPAAPFVVERFSCMYNCNDCLAGAEACGERCMNCGMVLLQEDRKVNPFEAYIKTIQKNY